MSNEKVFPQRARERFTYLAVGEDSRVYLLAPGKEPRLIETSFANWLLQEETEYGTSPDPGTSDRAARADHTHGSPPYPLLDQLLNVDLEAEEVSLAKYALVRRPGADPDDPDAWGVGSIEVPPEIIISEDVPLGTEGTVFVDLLGPGMLNPDGSRP